MDIKLLFAPVVSMTEQLVEQEKAAVRLNARVNFLSERVAKLEDEMISTEEWDKNHPSSTSLPIRSSRSEEVKMLPARYPANDSGVIGVVAAKKESKAKRDEVFLLNKEQLRDMPEGFYQEHENEQDQDEYPEF